MTWVTMQQETVQLPDDLQLPAASLPPEAAPGWAGSRLRRSLLLPAVLGVSGFTVLVVGLVFILGFVTRPYLGASASRPS